MQNKAKFANARTVAVLQQLFEQLTKADAIIGRSANLIAITASKAATIAGNNWSGLRESQMHDDGLRVSHTIFAGIERYGDTVLLELGALSSHMPSANIPRIEQLRRVFAELPSLRSGRKRA